MILVIDNYDSFVYNLARYIELAGYEAKIVRNDQITLEDIRIMAPEAIVISPGPCAPAQAGISRALIEEFGASIPILGVCLGHQAIGEAYGGRTVQAMFPVHGKSSQIEHNCEGLFAGIETNFTVGRYHSLIMELPKNSPLEVTAQSRDGDIMAVQHKTHPVYGVQFHPESILTEHGSLMIQNFIHMAESFMRSDAQNKSKICSSLKDTNKPSGLASQAHGQTVARGRSRDLEVRSDATPISTASSSSGFPVPEGETRRSLCQRVEDPPIKSEDDKVGSEDDKVGLENSEVEMENNSLSLRAHQRMGGVMGLQLWHNGEMRANDALLFPFTDRIRLGDGVFDTMLVLDGRACFAGEHAARLAHDAGVMGIDCPADLPQIIEDILSTNGDEIAKGHYALNTLLTRGAGQRGLRTPDHDNTQLILRLTPVPSPLPPIHAHIARHVHRNEGSPLSRIKSINYGDNILALREAEAAGANEAIMLNNARHVTSCTSGNIYARIDGRLFTPPLEDGVLNGVMRQILMDRLDITEKTLLEPDLESAENLYISNSIRGIVPIEKLDGGDIPVLPLEINNKLMETTNEHK